MPLAAGFRLGPYEVLARLGAGGMGEVWKGRDTRLGREVAIKVLPSELVAEGDRLKRFERKARAASSLSHPNIVTVFEIERFDGAPVIVMQLIEGKTLRETIDSGSLPLRKILQIAPQVAEGLARAIASTPGPAAASCGRRFRPPIPGPAAASRRSSSPPTARPASGHTSATRRNSSWPRG